MFIKMEFGQYDQWNSRTRSSFFANPVDTGTDRLVCQSVSTVFKVFLRLSEKHGVFIIALSKYGINTPFRLFNLHREYSVAPISKF